MSAQTDAGPARRADEVVVTPTMMANGEQLPSDDDGLVVQELPSDDCCDDPGVNVAASRKKNEQFALVTI